MLRFFRKFTTSAALVANIILIVVFLVACMAPYLHPKTGWFMGFMGLLFPYLLALLLLFAIFWLFIEPQKSLYSMLPILLSLGNARNTWAWNNAAEFPKIKDSASIRVMNWNVRYFIPFNDGKYASENNSSTAEVIEEIRKYNPDIICFQEMNSSYDASGRNGVRPLKEKLGYGFYYFSMDYFRFKFEVSGTAIFSRYPILKVKKTSFPKYMAKEAESTISVDIKIGRDTIRVSTLHLQSFRFMPTDYNLFSKIKAQQDTGLEGSKKIIRQMENTFMLHGEQADYISRALSNSPYPHIICGDLNDVPNSYAYRTIRGGFRDAFLERGSGLGQTYISPSSRSLGKLPTLRIDYIFTDPAIETIAFTINRKKISDHYALVADLKIGKKE